MPLELTQIEAADRLWNRLEELKRSDRALAALQGSLPGFDPEVTLLKVLSLHPIDTSKTHVGLPLARDLCALLSRVDPTGCGVELVDALAEVADRHGKSPHEGLGFASRFAHYFVDGERFPVLDAWSERALQALLGGELHGAPGDTRYGRFARNFAWVANRIGLTRRRRLGRWLWLIGQHLAWRSNPRTPINRAVRELFESQAVQIAALLPPEMQSAPPGTARECGGLDPESTEVPTATPPPAIPARTPYAARRRAGRTKP